MSIYGFWIQQMVHVLFVLGGSNKGIGNIIKWAQSRCLVSHLHSLCYKSQANAPVSDVKLPPKLCCHVLLKLWIKFWWGR